MKKILDGNDWELSYEDVLGTDKGKIKAQVPGNIEFDFINAGLFDGDLFYSQNIKNAEKFETYKFCYQKKFTIEEPEKEHRITFYGVDTFATYYINGEKIGSSKNMFVEHSFLVKNLVKGDNELKVVIQPTVLNNNQKSVDAYTSISWQGPEIAGARRPAHSNGWDILPRAISAGIYRTVVIETVPQHEFSSCYLATSVANEDSAVLYLLYDIESKERISQGGNYKMQIKGVSGDSTFFAEDTVFYRAGNIKFTVNNPKLWWIKGYGEPNLYQVTVTLLKDDKVILEQNFEFGIRTVKLKYSDENEKLEFRFILNNEPVFLKGVNWIPLSIYASKNAERLEKSFKCLADTNSNAVRCWGGGVYESDEFYSLCDREGILVWQDFAFGCANYPQTQEFFDEITIEGEKLVKRIRNHASVGLFAGDNEIDCMGLDYGINPLGNKINREVLPAVVYRHAPYTEYLISSPYTSKNTCKKGGLNYAPEQHLWCDRDWAKSEYYRNTKAVFISEIGNPGVPSPASLEKFIKKDSLNDFLSKDWRLHSTDKFYKAYRLNFVKKGVLLNFGYLPETYQEFSELSQYAQAEALKFFVENMRAKRSEKSGILLWNLQDGWPAINEALVDYYYDKKKAYGVVTRSFSDTLFLVYEDANSKYALKVVNDTLTKKELSYKVTDADSGEILVDGKVTVKENSEKELGIIKDIFFKKKCLIIEWIDNGKKYYNHFITGFPEYKAEDFRRWYKKLENL
ncbi:MAG: hypothetical protein J6V68_03520 [Clostridia bacterium]|nr:hypothetical protein [Clostridia bacterium]